MIMVSRHCVKAEDLTEETYTDVDLVLLVGIHGENGYRSFESIQDTRIVPPRRRLFRSSYRKRQSSVTRVAVNFASFGS